MAEQGGESSQRERAAVTVPDLQGAFGVVCSTPEERLLSITLQMGGGNGAVEQLVQAMALIALRREADALQRLRALGGHRIAGYLASQVSASRGRLEDVRVDTFEPPEPRVDTLRELARIYGVLVRERLCEASLRDQAYQAALLECRNNNNNNDDDNRNGNGEELRHTGASYLNELIEEVRGACGVEVSLKALRISSNSPQPLDAAASLAEGSLSAPTSLTSVTSSAFSSSSLPSHLEISAAPTEPAGGASHTDAPQISTHTQVAQHTPNSLTDASKHTLNSHTSASIHTLNSHTGSSTHTLNSHTGAPSAATVLVGREAEGCSGPVSACRADVDNGGGTTAVPVGPPAPGGAAAVGSAPGPAASAAAGIGSGAVAAAAGSAPSSAGSAPGPTGSAAAALTAAVAAGSVPGPAILDPPSHLPTQCSGRDGMHQLVTSVSAGVETQRPPEPMLPEFSRSVSAPEPASWQGEEEEEGAVFYSFVILHATEDEAAAVELRNKLESATAGTGATFSQDFHIPGRHALNCVDDAINNSAFTILLLTRNFSSRMQEVITNSALMNAIHNAHKYNTVIPLQPLKNPLPPDEVPMVLRTLVKLHESSRNFSHIARRAISPEKVKQQRRVWEQEQEVVRLREQQRRLVEENRRQQENIQQQQQYIRQHQEYNRQARERWELYHKLQSLTQSPTHLPPNFASPPGMAGPPPTPPPSYPPPTPPPSYPSPAPSPNYPPWPPQMTPYAFWPPQSPQSPANITIQNASCIMIGNDSTMTIGDPSVIQGVLDEDGMQEDLEED